ncbi:Soluble aldose sugar dehydrogenase YliI precursor [Caulifigura coniformis]|uniref:Soluble aldose sugar dehydrogenase YliI n=1 Tax=Caulifigura coniformis TaxID=2527983 RepID=A0A517S7Q4_9PLAN|nr:PQQ-dependent sugar dehydrogenase [Caulifigura coniformis]QDT52139.1 Soluble aldose sugar dehydrogenase YliI precursor [Caulifigura coniformis]
MLRSLQTFAAAAGACAALALNPVASANEPNTLTASEQKSGWKLLFDGKSADGFRDYQKDALNPAWIVKEGAIQKSDKASNMITKEKFGSFELSLEYKISEGGNSGLMFHVTEEEKMPWQTGPEIQLQDNKAGHDPQKSGWLYQLYPAMKDRVTGEITDATRPAGEWNQIQLRVTPAGSEINMNGIRYATFKKGSKDWDEKVAASKFAKHAKFGKATEGHICLQGDHAGQIAFRNIKIRNLPDDGTAPNPIDRELPLKVTQAFPKLTWTGWSPEDEAGRLQSHRPILLTHAGDGTNRAFVPTQHGVVHAFESKPDVEATKVFLDITDRVLYRDKENEQGFLGMAFHPKFKQNGEFFIYYTSSKIPAPEGKAAPCIVSRFRVSKDDPNKADPASEEQILLIEQPFWNHDGGTIVFGPDGYLYIALGDGGAGNDPFRNGQNTSKILGKILRIDVDKKENGKNYGIPKDNPFANTSGAAPEIFAYGFRNPWRIAFDRKTGHLWAADVGQNLWEEIDIVSIGKNYGWNFREGTKPFGSVAEPAAFESVAPIWEYDHQVGKSITGGFVYRGKKFPELEGKYLYADYVSGLIWALHYDEATGKVIANEGIPSEKLPIVSFGEDEAGEAYFMVVTPNGKGLYTFTK